MHRFPVPGECGMVSPLPYIPRRLVSAFTHRLKELIQILVLPLGLVTVFRHSIHNFLALPEFKIFWYCSFYITAFHAEDVCDDVDNEDTMMFFNPIWSFGVLVESFQSSLELMFTIRNYPVEIVSKNVAYLRLCAAILLKKLETEHAKEHE
jgi:hypothetical protein